MWSSIFGALRAGYIAKTWTYIPAICKMSKRKPHNARQRLRRVMAGCWAEFNGRGVDMYRPGGIRLHPVEVDAFTCGSWRWSITVMVDARSGGTLRTAEATYDINQPCKADELTDWLSDTGEKMAAEFPSMWTPEVVRWKAVVKG